MIRRLAASATLATSLLACGLAPARADLFDFLQPIFGGTPAGTVAPPREIVPYAGRERPGTVIVSTAERRLYLVEPGGQAMRYGVGVGRQGFTWGGVKTITAKREWPDWTPPLQMIKRRPDLPRHMKGGIDNPPRRPRDVPRWLRVPHSRLQRARDHRAGGLLGLHPHDQRRRRRSLRARSRRYQGHRPALTIKTTSGAHGARTRKRSAHALA